MPEVTLSGYKCARCGHTWLPRGEERPLLCPKCKSLRWDKETAAANKRKKAVAAK